MITVHFARHGESIWHIENRYAGSSDIPLTDRGREQSAALASWATENEIRVIASSDLQRSAETAAPAARAVGVELTVDPRLREVSFGQAEGLTANELQTYVPQAWEGFVRAPASRPLPGGEPGAAAANRFEAALVDILSHTAERALLVVGHTTILRLLYCKLLGVPLDNYRRAFPRLANCAVTTFEMPDAILRQNDLSGAGGLVAFNHPTAPPSH